MVYLSDKDLKETSDGTTDAVLGSLLSIAHDVCMCVCIRVWVKRVGEGIKVVSEVTTLE